MLASAPPYSNAGATTPGPAGLFTGKIVACERAPGRILKGFNVKQGGAAGMILYNPTLHDIETDNHWLPAVHLADGTAVPRVHGRTPRRDRDVHRGRQVDLAGDVMTYFSSRGPGGQFLKPDVTAPGLQILAGQTPVTESPDEGPPGELFQAIAGTSMSSPHVAGAAAAAARRTPDLGAGADQVRADDHRESRRWQDDDGSPVDPFEIGSGRIDLTKAGTPGLTFDETAANFVALGAEPGERGRPEPAVDQRTGDAG